MKILVYDTETTGLPLKFTKEKPVSLDIQPYIIQFAGVVGDLSSAGEWIRMEEYNFFIKPPITIPSYASDIHHIYDIDLVGKPSINEMLPEILRIINSVDVVVGHNVKFDNLMISIEVERMKHKGITLDFIPKNLFCTMDGSKSYCKLKRKPTDKFYKSPKLGELYKKCFGEYTAGAHDAMIDVTMTGKCFIKLFREGIVQLILKEERPSLF